MHGKKHFVNDIELAKMTNKHFENKQHKIAEISQQLCRVET